MSEFQLFSISKQGTYSLPIPEDTKTIHDLYKGFELGVYSALRSFEKNKFLDLDAHIARTKQSISILNWKFTFDEQLLRSGLHQILTNCPFKNAKVRFDILPNPVERGGIQFQMLVGLASFAGIPEILYADGVRVGFADTLNRVNPLAKTADFVNQRKAYEIGMKEMYERVLLNSEGDILECTSSNFYAVNNGTVYTAGEGILEGITRKIILEIIEQLNIPLILQAPQLEELPNFEEAGLSSSSRALIPIVQIGDYSVGNGRPGPIMQKILKHYRAYVKREVKTAVE